MAPLLLELASLEVEAVEVVYAGTEQQKTLTTMQHDAVAGLVKTDVFSTYQCTGDQCECSNGDDGSDDQYCWGPIPKQG